MAPRVKSVVALDDYELEVSCTEKNTQERIQHALKTEKLPGIVGSLTRIGVS